ncbi:clathrin light chain [Cristinia sonorae]|uniref:Clathrin light chain n=1 Tax=Cristinia sonorae TaxID=1940300 RepID=A0A8K0XRZ8_9AGAR|nr:clathrin light chain [Cristinia sonorae]
MTDFLQRESDILGNEFASSNATGDSFATAGGDIDFDRAASAFPDISLDGSTDFTASLNGSSGGAGAGTTNGFSFDDFDTPPRGNTEVKVTGDDEIEKFENEFPDIEVPQAQPTYSSPPQPSFGAAPPFAPRPQPSAFSNTPILNQAVQEEEPEAIRVWREQQAAAIKARDEASKAKREETIGKAERAIDQFYEEYSKKKERNIRENKEHEEEFLSRLTDSLASGTTWQRICDIIELENSQSKTIARSGAGTTDLTRFKEVLLRLKREGESAPGAAGY